MSLPARYLGRTRNLDWSSPYRVPAPTSAIKTYSNIVSIILLSPTLRTFAFQPVFYGRLACPLRSSSICSSLLFCNAHRPSSAAIISSYIKDVALPGLQRNMEREMMMNVRSKRWKRESGVKLNTKLVGLGRSWLVLNMELVELQVLKLASSFSHYQYILCPYSSPISQTARVPPRNAFSSHDVD